KSARSASPSPRPPASLCSAISAASFRKTANGRVRPRASRPAVYYPAGLMTAPTSEHHLTDHLLAEYPMPDEIRWGIAEAGFVFATPIQAKTLPIALAGRDVAGQAQTGTGKTAA